MLATKFGIATSLLGMVVALSGVTSGFAAGSTTPTEGNTAAGNAATSASVVVPPWCGWNINPVTAAIVLTSGGASYVGADLPLTGSTSSVNAYVGAIGDASEKPTSTNCSWFGKAAQAARLDVTVASDDAAFTAASGSNADSGMGWALSAKSLNITNTFAAGCTTDSFTSNPSATIDSAKTVTAWSISSGSVNTNNFCSYSVAYSTNVPAGKSPLFGDSTYTFTGPTLIHTLTTS